MWQEEENFSEVSQNGEVISSEFSPAAFSDCFTVNGFLDREPVLLKSCCPARSEAQGSTTDTADLQNITDFLC